MRAPTPEQPTPEQPTPEEPTPEQPEPETTAEAPLISTELAIILAVVVACIIGARDDENKPTIFLPFFGSKTKKKGEELKRHNLVKLKIKMRL